MSVSLPIALLFALAGLAAGAESLVAGDFTTARFLPVPDAPLQHGVLPEGWRDNAVWSKSDCTYQRIEEGGHAFLRITGAAKGRLQILHAMPAFTERRCLRVSLRLRAPAPLQLSVAVAALAPPWTVHASGTLASQQGWSDASVLIAGGPAPAPLGLLLYADSPGTLDLMSVVVEPVALADYRPATTIPIMRLDKDWYPSRHRQLVAAAEAQRPAVLLLGDSLTAAWEKEGKDAWAEYLAPLNSCHWGIGGDRVQHLLWRITESPLGGALVPRVAVVMIGVNNLSTDNPDDIAQGTAHVVAEIRRRSPATRVLLLGLLPVGEKPDDSNRARVREVNQRYARLADGGQVVFADLGGVLPAADGTIGREILHDGLHLTAAGYARLGAALVVELRRMLAP